MDKAQRQVAVEPLLSLPNKIKLDAADIDAGYYKKRTYYHRL